jgi:hypothetical protein
VIYLSLKCGAQLMDNLYILKDIGFDQSRAKNTPSKQHFATTFPNTMAEHVGLQKPYCVLYNLQFVLEEILACLSCDTVTFSSIMRI